MDLTNIYTSIEEMDDKTNKCLAYCEIILYLKEIVSSLNFKPTGVSWKDNINNMIIQDSVNEINAKIKELKNFVEFNVKH